MDKPPTLEYKRAPCPQCGARTYRQAETRCRPTRDMTDEYTCPGDDGHEWPDGYLRQPTKESIRRLNDWTEVNWIEDDGE